MTRDLYAGRRDIFVEYMYRDGSVEREPLYSNSNFEHASEQETLKARFYRSMQAKMRLSAEKKWPEECDASRKDCFEQEFRFLEEWS